MNWFRNRECVACDEHGEFVTWVARAHVLICPRHKVELAELIEAMPEFQAYRAAQMGWEEHLAALQGGALDEDGKHYVPNRFAGRNWREAGDAAAKVIRKAIDRMRREKPAVAAERKAEERDEREKKAAADTEPK